MLDFAGLDYDAVSRVITLDPALPIAWPHIGLTLHLPCGEVSYRLERPLGGTVYSLSLSSRLNHPVDLQIGVTCPGLAALGEWQASTDLLLPNSSGNPADLRGRSHYPKTIIA